jgi:hypothetical protein
MTFIPTSTLYTFADDKSFDLIAITGDTRMLENISGGEESTISVEGIVLLWDEEYIVSDIQINALQSIKRFEPNDFSGLTLGAAIDYSVIIRIMVAPRF